MRKIVNIWWTYCEQPFLWLWTLSIWESSSTRSLLYDAVWVSSINWVPDRHNHHDEPDNELTGVLAKAEKWVRSSNWQKFQITGEYLYIKLQICLKLKPNPSLCPQDTSWLNICLSTRKLQIHRHICTSPQAAREKVCFRSSIPKPSSGTTVNIINILIVTIYYSGFSLLISLISSKWKLFSISCIMVFRVVSPSFSAYQAPHEAGRWAPQGSNGVNPRELGMLGTWWFQISKVIEIIRAKKQGWLRWWSSRKSNRRECLKPPAHATAQSWRLGYFTIRRLMAHHPTFKDSLYS